jgi:2'-5' RNA ligase
MRYIVALIPSSQASIEYIQTAQALFAPSSEGYLLTEGKAYPHVTVCQYEYEKEEDAIAVWKKIEQIKIRSLPIRFIGMGFEVGMGKYKGLYWSSISAARDEKLMELHNKSMEVLKACNLKCINDNRDLYRPHITLALVKTPELLQKWPDTLLNDVGDFRLVLAQGDDVGQLVRVICE